MIYGQNHIWVVYSFELILNLFIFNILPESIYQSILYSVIWFDFSSNTRIAIWNQRLNENNFLFLIWFQINVPLFYGWIKSEIMELIQIISLAAFDTCQMKISGNWRKNQTHPYSEIS